MFDQFRGRRFTMSPAAAANPVRTALGVTPSAYPTMILAWACKKSCNCSATPDGKAPLRHRLEKRKSTSCKNVAGAQHNPRVANPPILFAACAISAQERAPVRMRFVTESGARSFNRSSSSARRAHGVASTIRVRFVGRTLARFPKSYPHVLPRLARTSCSPGHKRDTRAWPNLQRIEMAEIFASVRSRAQAVSRRWARSHRPP